MSLYQRHLNRLIKRFGEDHPIVLKRKLQFKAMKEHADRVKELST